MTTGGSGRAVDTDNVGWDHLMCYICKLHEEAIRLAANPRAFVPELDLPILVELPCSCNLSLSEAKGNWKAVAGPCRRPVRS